MPALPAIAIVTAVVVVQRLKARIPIWAPGTVAILTVISGMGIMGEPLLLSRTILLSWFQWHIFIQASLLDKPFQDETRARRGSDLPAMASPPLKRIKSGVHRWVIISKLVGVAIRKFVIMYGDDRPPNWFDAQLIPAGERIGDQFDEGIDKARPDEAR